jgi:hypothetical protein
MFYLRSVQKKINYEILSLLQLVPFQGSEHQPEELVVISIIQKPGLICRQCSKIL